MEVCIARIILKYMCMASEKLYRNTLSTVREVFRGRVGCLEPVFSHDGTSWRVLIPCLKEKRKAQLGANHLAFDKGEGGGGVALEDLKKNTLQPPKQRKKVQCMISSNEKESCMPGASKKKFLRIIDSPSLRVTNLSHLHTSYAPLFKKARLSQKLRSSLSLSCLLIKGYII